MGAEAAGFEVTTAALTKHARSVDRIAEAIDTAITGEAWNAFRPPSAW
ncbi:hypothetical protein [Micromonospora arborensis]|nr:hypothetical protein [Micromonospora arborensis]